MLFPLITKSFSNPHSKNYEKATTKKPPQTT